MNYKASNGGMIMSDTLGMTGEKLSRNIIITHTELWSETQQK
jgi:hypothetical protein